MLEWSVKFLENGKENEELNNAFGPVAGFNSYQYFDLSYNNKRVIIEKKDDYNNPNHNIRWESCLKNLSVSLFKGASILDLGANGGFWSLKSRMLGADKLTLVDSNVDNFEQAKFLFNFFDLNYNISYVTEDIRNFHPKETYDISFMMRVLHFISREDREILFKNIFPFSKRVIISPIEKYLASEAKIISIGGTEYLSAALVVGGTDGEN